MVHNCESEGTGKDREGSAATGSAAGSKALQLC